MNQDEKKYLAQGIAAVCVRDAWNKGLGDPYSKHEEMRHFMNTVVNRVYTVLLHMDEPDFKRKLATYGSLASGVWNEPEQITGLLDDGFVAQVDRIFSSQETEEN